MEKSELNKEHKPYKRISCDLYDYYEIWAMRKQQIDIEYRANDDELITTKLIIETLETHEKDEFLISTEGLRIRLDQIMKAKPVD